MFKYFWLLLAIASLVYAVSGFATGEITFGSTSKVNGRELKLAGPAAIVFCMCSLSAAIAFGSMGAAEFYVKHASLFSRVTKFALAGTVIFFVGTVCAVFLKKVL